MITGVIISLLMSSQAIFMDYPQGERAITQHRGPVWIGEYKQPQMQPGPTLNVLSGARHDNGNMLIQV
jgi:hypothetical protein